MTIRYTLSLLALAGGCSLAIARLPEPCNIYYGEAIGPQGVTLTGAANAVVARIGGIECARYYIGGYAASNANYAVRIPLDDGLDLRYDTTAARAGEQPVFAVVCNGAEFPVDTLPPTVGTRGALQRFDFEAAPEPLCIPFAAAALAVLTRARRRRNSL